MVTKLRTKLQNFEHQPPARPKLCYIRVEYTIRKKYEKKRIKEPQRKEIKEPQKKLKEPQKKLKESQNEKLKDNVKHTKDKTKIVEQKDYETKENSNAKPKKKKPQE